MISWTNDFHSEIMVVHNIRTTTSSPFQVAICYLESQDNTWMLIVIFPSSSCLMQKCTEQGEQYNTILGVSYIFYWSNCSLQKIRYFCPSLWMLIVWVKIFCIIWHLQMTFSSIQPFWIVTFLFLFERALSCPYSLRTVMEPR